MRLAYTLCALLWAVVLAAMACGGNGWGVGEACDPGHGDRDCSPDLACAYSYNDCPTNGCPKCRRTCRSDADCPADDTKSCGKTPHCQFQQRTDFQGLCDVCDTIKPIFPP
jgi:hypothetical protein